MSAFADTLSRFLAYPRELVFGRGTSAQARDRFSGAVSDLISLSFPGAILIVTHGTVLSRFVAAATGLDAHACWRARPIPALVVLAPPTQGPHGWRLEELWPPALGAAQ